MLFALQRLTWSLIVRSRCLILLRKQLAVLGTVYRGLRGCLRSPWARSLPFLAILEVVLVRRSQGCGLAWEIAEQ